MSLLRLCHAGRRKTLAFTSSVSTCLGPGHASSTVPEQPIGSDPTVALSTGYAQSKYIVERLTQLACKTLSQKVVLLRVGQLCGSTATGHWNTSEMWPIMFATSFHPRMKCVPMLEGQRVDWIPVDVAAVAVTELLLSSHLTSASASPQRQEEEKYSVHNIVNPKSISWAELVHMLQAIRTQSGDAEDMQQVSMREWTARLSSLSTSISPDQLPGLKLLLFFENMAESAEQESKVFETGRSEGLSGALRECRPFCEEWLRRNVMVWREVGFLG